MTLIAGLDFGSSGLKLVVVDLDGTVVARSQAAYPTSHGRSGEVEQDPADWWRAARDALAECGIADRIDAVGLTGQMQDLIVVAGGRELRPALLYSDTRASAQQDRLAAEVGDWERRVENHLDVTNVAAKIAWLADHEPDTLRRAESLLFGAGAYVGYRLGGRAACDLTTASTTGLLDVTARDWLTDGVTAAGARPDQLPQLIGGEADAVIGKVSREAAADLGLREGVPIVLGMGDAGATTDGIVGIEPGDSYLYLGSTGWLAGVTDTPPDEPSPIHSLALPGWRRRLRIGSVQSAGSAAAWALATFLPGRRFDDAEREVADSVGVLDRRPLCLPGIAGERTPVRDGAFRGAFVGASEATGAVDFYLAVLTGVALGLRHAADELGIHQRRIPLVGGAASSRAWRQILADVFDATIVTGVPGEPGPHSAARSAAGALGLAHSLRPLLGEGAAVEETVPSSANYGPLISIHRQVYPALAQTFHNLHRVRVADPSRKATS